MGISRFFLSFFLTRRSFSSESSQLFYFIFLLSSHLLYRGCQNTVIGLVMRFAENLIELSFMHLYWKCISLSFFHGVIAFDCA